MQINSTTGKFAPFPPVDASWSTFDYSTIEYDLSTPTGIKVTALLSDTDTTCSSVENVPYFSTMVDATTRTLTGMSNYDFVADNSPAYLSELLADLAAIPTPITAPGICPSTKCSSSDSECKNAQKLAQ